MVTAANRLSDALRNWADWDLITPLAAAPRLGPVLSEGSGHILFELLDEPLLVARIRRRPTSEVEGAFSGEVEIWSAAAAAGIAPALIYVDRQQQAVICERAREAPQPITGGALGQLMCAIHTLPKVNRRLTLRADAAAYLSSVPAEQRGTWQSIVHRPDIDQAFSLLEQDTDYLCHNDLTVGNLLARGDRLVAIDWEYAAMGSRYFDVAIAMTDLPMIEQPLLAERVFGQSLSVKLLTAGRNIAALMTALWQHRFDPSQAPDPRTDLSWLPRR
jgi:hypothetical protein